ncbi:hypothetical protein BS50DRAFT_17494 [Corynespora cassiicola Philippines]|uniref:Uncharacterized protein n=1 Tax=Corynespora cassiicola Philippines TaxID=1448308 RepID=A0A2T2PA02_CORCC|nr:hypothetical protein BS50DRAFT_17494 [Corynespora cassiicola Philippines]
MTSSFRSAPSATRLPLLAARQPPPAEKEDESSDGNPSLKTQGIMKILLIVGLSIIGYMIWVSSLSGLPFGSILTLQQPIADEEYIPGIFKRNYDEGMATNVQNYANISAASPPSVRAIVMITSTAASTTTTIPTTLKTTKRLITSPILFTGQTTSISPGASAFPPLSTSKLRIFKPHYATFTSSQNCGPSSSSSTSLSETKKMIGDEAWEVATQAGLSTTLGQI